MSIFDLLISKIAPHECLNCRVEGSLMCISCINKLVVVPERCYRCHEFSPDWLTCRGCQPTSYLSSVRVGTVYEGGAKDLIWKLKLAGARSAARIMAETLAPRVQQAAKPLNQNAQAPIIVPVPTATGRARQRGYDQARLLARELARQTRLPYRDCLARQGQLHQHGLTRRQRLSQLNGAFRVTRPQIIKKGNIILVDDVVTTGATLEAAASVLKAAGARQIDAVIFAQP
jgi:competence protein ComFC